MSEKAIEDFIEGEAQVAEKVVQDLSGNPAQPSKWICKFKLYEFWVFSPHHKEASMSHALKPPPRKQEDAVIVIALLTLAFIGFIT